MDEPGNESTHIRKLIILYVFLMQEQPNPPCLVSLNTIWGIEQLQLGAGLRAIARSDLSSSKRGFLSANLENPSKLAATKVVNFSDFNY
ncbi:hypothetical protein PCC6311_0485 [Synechococcus elongatus PCC 6311]|nr:hypothetical protein M744_00615 [Synechococcus elongatus UTEX 2973]UOW70258.1 hypothetical protein PCC7943_0485 [Synechococcus elongatus PCC 7943]UOW72979.1 hypothetical protein PCC6311_0485 [Synechococcus elongatus PCC 6311]UOW75700.1 hypothetical protein PCC6301pg_0485 [Synechococcus elongatus PCC 6301]